MAAERKRNIKKFIPMKFDYVSLMKKYEGEIDVVYIWSQMTS